MLDSDSAGRLVAIHVAHHAGAPMESREAAVAVEGRGLEGDRYHTATGHWSPIRRSGDGLTIVDGDVIDRVSRAHELGLGPGDTRRNLTSRGIDLDAAIGRRLAIGPVEVRVVRRCEPCSYLDGLLGRDVLPHLVHLAGVRVDVLRGGTLRVGDVISVLDD
jgi:MOSC domain-containing protein YiiM